MADPAPPPPGWYPSPEGTRWWNGSEWSAPAWTYPVAAAPSEEDAGRTLATISHLGAFVGGFITPLVIYLMEKDKNRFVRHHAAEALNFQITLMLVWLAGFALLFVAMFTAGSSDSPDAAPGLAFFLLFPAMFAMMIVNYVLSIIAMVKANQKQWFRYRIAIPFVH